MSKISEFTDSLKNEQPIEEFFDQIPNELGSWTPVLKVTDVGTSEEMMRQYFENKETLDQLHFHYLDDSYNFTREVKEVADAISVESGLEKDRTVKMKAWDKDITELPTVNRLPCSFPRQYREKISGGRKFIPYMADPATQIAEIEVGDEKGYVISNIAVIDDDPYLHIHSVESEENIASNRGVANAIHESIIEYAETMSEHSQNLRGIDRDLNIEGVIFNNENHNSNAIEFLNTISEKYDNPEKVEAEKLGSQEVYLDSGYPQNPYINAFVEELESNN